MNCLAAGKTAAPVFRALKADQDAVGICTEDRNNATGIFAIGCDNGGVDGTRGIHKNHIPFRKSEKVGRKMLVRLKECRTEVGMSQEQLSERSGVCRTIISGLESGRLKDAKFSTLEKLAKAMGKRIYEIVS